MSSPTSISIQTLSSGVGRQPMSKRTPYEAQELDNCLVSLEKSVEKRPGFEVLSYSPAVFDLSFLPVNLDPHFEWFTLDNDNRFLIIIDRAAPTTASTLYYVIKVDGNTWTNVTPDFQWDPADPALYWNGVTPPTENSTQIALYNNAVSTVSPGQTVYERYTQLLTGGILDVNSRNYLTHGMGDTRDILKTIHFGSSVIYLNTHVYAGFTSGTNGYTVDNYGLSTLTTDLIGQKVTYYSALKVRRTTDGRFYPQGTILAPGDEWDTTFVAKYIPVDTYVYGSFETPWLGQSVENFGELRLPPGKNDFYANNSELDETPDDTSARDMLALLYDPATAFADGAGVSPVDGRGKIYFCNAAYLSLDPGYYRIVNFPTSETSDLASLVGTGKPYTQKVRSPDNCSVIDQGRMPQQLSWDGLKFTLAPIDWSHRTIGDRVTNPGPSPFLNEDMEARHVRLTAICNFRDRLFLAAGDVVFSSQLGVLNDLWIKDPSNIGVSDPIDVRAASNLYAEITAMLPFDKYLFLNTKGSIQFELKGDNGLISPLTAEISQTTFYTTLDLVSPQVLGSQIYFWDSGRLYVYLNQDSRQLNTAIEVSSTVRGYLPSDIEATCTANAQSYVIGVDGNNRSDVYIYCNRFSGDRIAQSAFWRYRLDTVDSIRGVNVWNEYLYTISRRVSDTTTWYIMRTKLESEETNVPRLDYLSLLALSDKNVQSAGLTNTLTIPYSMPSEDVVVVLSDDFGDDALSVYPASSILAQGNSTVLTVRGFNLYSHLGKRVYIGSKFQMLIELSTQFQRDQNLNIMEGVLNLKTLTVRHTNTGAYTVQAIRRGRSTTLDTTFSATNLEGLIHIQPDGVLAAKIFGFAESTVVKILSDSPAPCNITQLEFRGIYSRKNSSLR